MTDKPPPYNPNIYPSQSSYPPPPPPYHQQTTTATIVTGVTAPGRSTTCVTGQGYGQSYGTVGGTPVVVRPVSTTSIIVVGGCPACRVGVLNEEFTLGGLCCAFLFFPIGILCCLAMRERRCTNCGATFSA